MTAVALSVSGARKAFGGLVAVNDVSFDVHEGELFGLIGPNGSGKTTMLNLISGALKPDAGEIRLSGTRISGLPAHQIARHGVARTFQLVRMLPSDGCGAQRDGRRRVRPSARCGAAARAMCARVAGAGRSARPRACAGRRP